MGYRIMKRLEYKVILVFPYALARRGGPAGYGFVLSKALASIDHQNLIEIVTPQKPRDKSSHGMHSAKWRILKAMPRDIFAFLLGIRSLMLQRKALNYFGFVSEQLTRMKSVKVLIFHDYRLAMAYMSKIGRQQGQRILVMPHGPTDLSSEWLENWRSEVGASHVMSMFHRIMGKKEFETLLRCDGLVVPCRNSLDAYFEYLPAKRSLLYSQKIYKIPSGVSPLTNKRGRAEVFARWQIPVDAKVVGFFGRRHIHKGFDLFCRIAEIASQRGYQDLFFVTAGIGPLPSPTYLSNWRDLGYLDAELPDVVASVDLIVVPNRVSYFDLFVLEAMSLSKPLLISKVGGNICLHSPGIFCIEKLCPEAMLSQIVELLSDHERLQRAGEDNRTVYENIYSEKAFAFRWLNFAKMILED